VRSKCPVHFGCALAIVLSRRGLGADGHANRQGPGSKLRPLLRGFLAQQATARMRTAQESSTAKLAKFFPEATPVRIPIHLTRMGQSTAFSESTIIEFGTPREVLFASSLPMEFGDKLRVQNSDGTLDEEACVVAVQYNTGRTAVAARFTHNVSNWIVKS
jgi:hypothetical protein